MPVPQTEQTPFIALRLPVFPMATSSAPFISRFSLHLTQYPITGSICNACLLNNVPSS